MDGGIVRVSPFFIAYSHHNTCEACGFSFSRSTMLYNVTITFTDRREYNGRRCISCFARFATSDLELGKVRWAE